MATGQVLFQRFYYSKSFVRHGMETTAMSCVCLASKIEEAPRRIRDVINVFFHIKQVRAQRTIQPMILDAAYISMKTQVIKAERRVLKELGFCVHVKHPHKVQLINSYCFFFKYLISLSFEFLADRHVSAGARLREEPEADAVRLELHERLVAHGRLRPVQSGDDRLRLHLFDGAQAELSVAKQSALVCCVQGGRGRHYRRVVSHRGAVSTGKGK